VAIIPASADTTSLRPDLTTVPLEGVEPSHVVLATRAGDHSRLVAAFRKCAEAHLTGPDPAKPASVPPTRAEAEPTPRPNTPTAPSTCPVAGSGTSSSSLRVAFWRRVRPRGMALSAPSR